MNPIMLSCCKFLSLDLSEMLQLMATRYGDLDVRDRARFYHQLMLTVSGDKVSVKIHFPKKETHKTLQKHKLCCCISIHLLLQFLLMMLMNPLQLSAILTLASDSATGSSLADIVEGMLTQQYVDATVWWEFLIDSMPSNSALYKQLINSAAAGNKKNKNKKNAMSKIGTGYKNAWQRFGKEYDSSCEQKF